MSVNPLKLNVAEVAGEIVLAEAHCESPAGPAPASTAPAQPDVKPQTATGTGTGTVTGTGTGSGITADANLAETGGGSMTAYIAGGALTLLGIGGCALFLTRRRRAS